jgi:peroxiredoxin (alkyl hydroperoxide reductase subunit C)
MLLFRATYLIDETGKIFHESVNDILGRNVNEYLHGGCLYSYQEKEKFALLTGKLEEA